MKVVASNAIKKGKVTKLSCKLKVKPQMYIRKSRWQPWETGEIKLKDKWHWCPTVNDLHAHSSSYGKRMEAPKGKTKEWGYSDHEMGIWPTL
jgi:hypothetical protein